MRIGILIAVLLVFKLVDAGAEEKTMPVLFPDEKILLVPFDAERWSAPRNLERFGRWGCGVSICASLEGDFVVDDVLLFCRDPVWAGSPGRSSSASDLGGDCSCDSLLDHGLHLVHECGQLSSCEQTPIGSWDG